MIGLKDHSDEENLHIEILMPSLLVTQKGQLFIAPKTGQVGYKNDSGSVIMILYASSM